MKFYTLFENTFLMRAFYPKWITRCFLVAVLIVFTTIGTLGQNAILDSLRNSIKTAKEDSVRVKSLYKLSDLYREKNLDSALLFAKKADSISEKSRSILSQINTLSMLGTIYTLRGQYDQALEYLLRSVKQAEKLGDTIKLIKAYSALGELYGYSFKNFEKAIYYGNITIKFSEQIKDTPLLVMQLNNLSNFYFNSRNYDRPLAIARQQLDIARQQKDTGSIATTLCSIGDVYREKKNYDTCIIYYNEGTGLLKHLAEKDSSYYPILAMMYGNSSIPYVILKKYPEAIEIINSEIRIFKKTGFKRNVIDGYHRLVTVYMATNEWGKAKEFNAYCLEYFSKTHLTIDFNAELKRNAEICTHLGDYKTAYEQLDSFIDIQSSLQNTESQNKISGLESAVVAEKKQTEIDLINKDKEQQKILRNFLIAGCLLILITALIILRSRMQKQRDNITITKEKQRSDDLLLNILPSEVAEELKNKGNAEAKYFDEVTVLFTDFVGFTKVSERLTPTELVGELNACFSAFDGIMGKYNIEKIKTVGDAYLAVSGLPLPDSIHAGHVVKAAIEIRDFMLERGKLMGNKTFEIRIGIHSGSVVAGIVGVKKFAYDIWGDTVNTAARMEQNSEAGKINISQTTYELVKDKFDCEYRGEIEAKNKGKLKMYYASSTVASA